MNISEIYNVVVEAAKNIGTVGATTAVLTGAAGAAGKAAFEGLKAWFSKTFGGEAEITQQLTALESNPHDATTQAQFRACLEQHAMQFQNVEFIGLVKIIQSIQQNSGTTYNQYAETIKNVSISGGVNNFSF